MKRRKFLQLSAASAPALGMTGLLSCANPAAENVPAAHKVKPFELDELAISETLLELRILGHEFLFFEQPKYE